MEINNGHMQLYAGLLMNILHPDMEQYWFTNLARQPTFFEVEQCMPKDTNSSWYNSSI